MHRRHNRGVYETQQAALLLVGVVPARIDAVDPRPGRVRMVVKGEEPATTRDMEPGIAVDQHSLEHRAVVTVQHTDHLQHVIPAELLQPLHTGFWPAKNLELALEHLTVALRERSGIGITRTLRGASQKQGAKFTVQGYRVVKFREAERHRKERGYLNQVGRSPSVASRSFDSRPTEC